MLEGTNMKFLKILSLVIFYSLIFVILTEGHSYVVTSNQLIKDGYTFNTENGNPPYPTNVETFSARYDKIDKNAIFSNSYGEEYKSRPILLFGDTFADSLSLEREQKFGFKLSEHLRKPVHSFANAGWGFQHLYYLLKNEPMLNKYSNADTIIFVWNPDMVNRLFAFSFYPHHDYLYLKYKLVDGKLVEDIPQALFLYNSYLFRNIERKNGINKVKNSLVNGDNSVIELMTALILQSKQIADDKYKNLKKFIVFRYVPKELSLANIYENTVFSELKNMFYSFEKAGIIVVDLPALSDEDLYYKEGYRASDYGPSERAIDDFIEPFIQNAGL